MGSGRVGESGGDGVLESAGEWTGVEGERGRGRGKAVEACGVEEAEEAV